MTDEELKTKIRNIVSKHGTLTFELKNLHPNNGRKIFLGSELEALEEQFVILNATHLLRFGVQFPKQLGLQ